MATGKFVWHDLSTPDPATAAAFYARVFGWQSADAGLPGGAYTVFSLGAKPVGGMMATAPGVTPMWSGHIGVDDVDLTASRLIAAGGQIVHAPEDIPGGVGRFAVVLDPEAARFVLFRPNGPDPAPAPADSAEPGIVGWSELYANDLTAAWTFYAGLFNWTRDAAIDMGPMGLYQLFAAGGAVIGGMMTRLPEVPAPFWLFYINVGSVGAALETILANGGTRLNGPSQVAGGSWIAQCTDPAGAPFGISSRTP